MELNKLKRNTKNKKKRVVGRGGKHAKTSGRGTKGQNARAGRKKRPEYRDRIKKLPKKRGYKFSSISSGFQTINVSSLNNLFTAGDIVNPQSLLLKRVVRNINGKKPDVKILGTGDINISLKIEDCIVSESAKLKIEKAGGSVK